MQQSSQGGWCAHVESSDIFYAIPVHYLYVSIDSHGS